MKTCLVENCELKYYAKGFCKRHYDRSWRTGDPGEAASRIRYNPSPICSVSGCDRPHSSLGLCELHYRRQRKGFTGERPQREILKDGSCRCHGCGESFIPIGKASGVKCPRCHRLWKFFGLTARDYQEMLDRQGGKCAICPTAIVGQVLGVDHDHSCCPGTKTCGKCIRGLLCVSHNTAIGSFHDDLESIQRALIYLQENSPTPRNQKQERKQ